MPLLTDTLPYEVPVLFSNRGFYQTIKNEYNEWYKEKMYKKAKGEINKEYNLSELDTTIRTFLKECFFKNKNLSTLQNILEKTLDSALIPYEYKIQKNDSKFRNISLIHPISQLLICDFYAQYHEELLYYTNKSDVSLRYPIKKATKVFRQHNKLLSKLTTEETEKETEYENIANNFFVYKKYRHVYAFYDSVELQNLEQRFKFCYKFDIRRCFESFYTHSIEWAVKNKKYVKQYLHTKSRNSSFESTLDNLIQRSNWNETHGIPIGAEFSRIFAEIILQQIDTNVENKLIHKKNIKKSKDFIIKRYVDDYFVFVNSEDLGKIIQNEYETALLEYKLFTNQDKEVILQRPFITPISIAKQKIIPNLRKFLNEVHFSNQIDTTLTIENLFSIKSNFKVSELIKDIRVATTDTNVNVSDVSNIILSCIKKELIKVLDLLLSLDNDENKNKIKNKFQDETLKIFRNYINNVLELSFYIFHLSSRTNTTYGICKICFIIIELLKIIDNKKFKAEIYQKIYTSLLLFLESKKKSLNPLVELLDIIWIIKELGNNFTLEVNQLNDIYNKSNKNYFELMVVLSYIENISKYDEIRKEVIEKIKSLFLENSEFIFIKSDLFMMFFDTIKCPYLTKKEKNDILTVVNIKKNNQKKLREFIEQREWFFNWNEKISLKIFLEIKELRNAY